MVLIGCVVATGAIVYHGVQSSAAAGGVTPGVATTVSDGPNPSSSVPAKDRTPPRSAVSPTPSATATPIALTLGQVRNLPRPAPPTGAGGSRSPQTAPEYPPADPGQPADAITPDSAPNASPIPSPSPAQTVPVNGPGRSPVPAPAPTEPTIVTPTPAQPPTATSTPLSEPPVWWETPPPLPRPWPAPEPHGTGPIEGN